MTINHKQHGATLIITLIILLILTILGVAVMQSSVMEEKMAGNSMDRNEAFQAAELALRDAEQRIMSWVDEPLSGSRMLLSSNDLGPMIYLGENSGVDGEAQSVRDAHTAYRTQLNTPSRGWWTNNINTFPLAIGNNFEIAGLATQPRYTIEKHSVVCDTLNAQSSSNCSHVFRITASVWSARNTPVQIQTMFSRRF